MNPDAGLQQTWSWILWHGSLAASRNYIALAHPLAILTAFVAAPITALNPLLQQVGLQVLCKHIVRKPNVKDFETLSNDLPLLRDFGKIK